MLLRLSGRPLGDVVGAALAGNMTLVVVKVPVNADMKEFMGAVGNHTKHGADYQSHDVVKPKGNSKGAIAYRLVFVRTLPPPVSSALPIVESAALPTVVTLELSPA